MNDHPLHRRRIPPGFLKFGFRNRNSLKRVDKHRIPAKSDDEIRCFLVGRNIGARLPFFLKYHRNMGVERFFYVDNDSSDNAVDFLLQQSDVHIWKTHQAFQESRFGTDWQEALLKKYGQGHWCLLLDIDEFFFFPYCDQGVTLQRFTAWLDSMEAVAVQSILIDMYSKKGINATRFDENENLFEICPYFDMPQDIDLFFGAAPDEITGVHGQGVRKRVFSQPMCIRKWPFLKYMKAISFGTEGGHHLFLGNPRNVSTVKTVVFHFKFFSDFHTYVRDCIKRNCHWRDSGEYRAYLEKLDADKDLRLYDKRVSMRFRGTPDLIKRKILSDVDYDL